MLTRTNLSKIRKSIAEFKIYLMRTQTYLSPIQLFMIFIIFLNTTVWNVDWIQSFFVTKSSFIGVGVVVFLFCILLIGYIDTKLKMYMIERGRNETVERNPFIELYALWTVIAISNSKNPEKLEKLINQSLKDTTLEKTYLKFKETHNL